MATRRVLCRSLDRAGLCKILTRIPAHPPEDRWRRAYRVVMESGLEMSVPSRPAADRIIDRTVMTFVSALEPTDEVEEKRVIDCCRG